jgi:phage terminase large subunit GpA-like protein
MPKAKERWRFYIECVHCGENINFADAPSPDDDAHPSHRGVALECAHCHTDHVYLGSQVRRGLDDGDSR